MSQKSQVVYFARVAGLVKIGTTGNLWHRLAQLGKPELLGVIPGAFAEESRLHRMFAADRVHGEVFAASPRLLAYVAEHGTMPEPPAPKERKREEPEVTAALPPWMRSSAWHN